MEGTIYQQELTKGLPLMDPPNCVLQAILKVKAVAIASMKNPNWWTYWCTTSGGIRANLLTSMTVISEGAMFASIMTNVNEWKFYS